MVPNEADVKSYTIQDIKSIITVNGRIYILNILENGEPNHGICVQMWLLS